jgi:putative NADH-flavin reductase
LEDLETAFPKEITDLKQKIVDAKKTTEQYEENTKALAEELRVLKA